MSIFPQGSFIFDASKGETPQTIARKREIADRIMYGRRRSPQNIGEGIAALGDGIVAGVLNRRANKAEEAGFARQGELSQLSTTSGLLKPQSFAGSTRTRTGSKGSQPGKICLGGRKPMRFG